MKTKRKILIFVALLSLFYCITLVEETYAKYTSSATANASLTVARWNILINDQDIVQNSNFTESITPVFPGTSNIKADVIAPTAEGYFDVVLNGTDTDVSFSYNIGLELAEENTVEDLILTKYIIDDVEYEYVDGISGNILRSDTDKVKNVRFFVKWDDNIDTEAMDNAADTAAAKNGVAVFKVNVNLIQLQ